MLRLYFKIIGGKMWLVLFKLINKSHQRIWRIVYFIVQCLLPSYYIPKRKHMIDKFVFKHYFVSINWSLNITFTENVKKYLFFAIPNYNCLNSMEGAPSFVLVFLCVMINVPPLFLPMVPC